MEAYLKKFMRSLLEHKNNLSEYVNELYADDFREDDLNALFGELKKEGLVTCIYADNRAYEVQLTIKGKNIPVSKLKLSDKEELLILIQSIDEIKQYFHREDDKWKLYDEISDIDEFSIWLKQVKMYLQDIYNRTHDTFILDSINACNKHMNGTNDKKIFNEIVGYLRAIEKNIEKYYLDENAYPENTEEVEMEKILKPLIFISHSSKNKEQVKLLVEMLRAINLQPKKDIFCSSLPGYDIPIDSEDRIFDFLRSRFLEYKIHVFFIHSHEYYDSPVSLNEMGAAWALKTTQTSLLLPGFKFSDMKGVINGERMAIKLDNDVIEVKDKLSQVRHILENEFNLIPVQDTIWEQARDKFIEGINRPKEQQKQSEVFSKEFKFLLEKAAADATGQILMSFSLESGTSIQIGQTVIVSELPDRREYAKWDEALKQAINSGYIQKKNENIYAITNKGYEQVDKKWIVEEL